MKSHFLIFILLFSFTSFSHAEDYYKSDFRANVQLSSGDLGVFDLVERALRSRQQNVYAQKLTVTQQETEAGQACRLANRREALATLEYRNSQGVLNTISYIVCVADQAQDDFIVRPVEGSEKVVPEEGFKAGTWTFTMDKKGENDDGGECGVAKTVVQKVCAPAPYKIYAWEINPNVIKSSLSSLQKVEIDPGSPNCVDVSFHMEGKGQNQLKMPANLPDVKLACAEGAWFKYTITLRGYLTGYKN